MPEHRYPRRWKSFESENTYFECLEPKGILRYWNGAKWIIPARVNGGENEAAIEGNREEIFDHHEAPEIKAQFEKRCAIVYLKSVVRDIRKENEWFRQEHNSLKEKLARQEEQLRAMRAKLEGRKKALRHGKRKATSQTTTP